MPTQQMAAVDIDDREIASVVTYVRQAWGNSASEVTEQEVADFGPNPPLKRNNGPVTNFVPLPFRK